ncbi:MAG: serine/threonine-protein kinase PknG [Acidimicrobiaceae bacterium]|jgi:serine/threonine-protein kinase PknG|nr:serine/threonine-protein kinase PknG [Acidimicrobiaceae bacterium]
MAVPEVPEDKRFCAHCGEPVGRGRSGVKGRPEGFCRNCGHAFSFSPKLVRGDLVAGQYEVMGCLAHGGLGWIYLARDHNVSDRWVVLKGLLDAGDDDAMIAALAERRFLAQVEHPNIVKIFNFVQHKGSGYIVMEYVGGASLKDLLKERRTAAGKVDPLPPEQAIAYILEILPALGYLHRLDLLYCDFKPDNVIQSEESLKLIDLGGVRRIDDETSAVYGTVGYQAPEIADAGPSVSSDLYTVARTLAALSIDFKGYQREYVAALPRPDDVALFTRFDSLYRFLLKGTAPDPGARFQTAEEMAEQLLGVLREVVATNTGIPRPALSGFFTTDLRARPDSADWRLLPALVVAADDPAAGYLATLAAAESSEQIELLQEAPIKSVEIDFRLARSLIDIGQHAAAEEILGRLQADDPGDWRVWWTRGLSAIDQGDTAGAWAAFDWVYGNLPGELAPKLALAVTAELGGAPERALPWYDAVSRTDAGFTTASFGLARCRLAGGDRVGAVEAYNRVPEGSSSYLDAQLSAARALIEVDGTTAPELSDLGRAEATVAHLKLTGEQRASLTRELYEAALQLLRTGRIHPDPSVTLLGEPVTEVRLRLGLERAYRALARLSATPEDRITLIDQANQVRPRTLW